MDEALALHRAGRLDEAALKYEALLALNPHESELLHLLGILAGQQGDYTRSLALLARAIALQPQAPEFRNSLAVTCERMGDILQAADAFNQQGNLLLTAERFAEALPAFDHAVRLHPGSPFYRCNRGVALLKLGRYADSIAQLAAIPDEGRLSYVPLNLGNALAGLARTGEAIAAYDRTLTLEPGLAEATWARGQVLMLTGNYTAGLAEYEARRRWSGFDNPYRAVPEWNGRKLDGKLLVICEQGLGDTIQFARYLPRLAAEGHDIVFEIHDPLYSLFRTGFDCPGITMLPRSRLLAGDIGRCLAHIPLMSLPHHFATTVDTIPGKTPYLSVAPESVRAMATRLPATGRRKIGIVRAGQSRLGNDFARSLPAATLAPLLTADADFYSLQVTPFGADGVTELGLTFTDFTDTAAAIMAMDLVISCDTSVAHLAGALGRPVWLMLSAAPDWRWGLAGETTPWYPIARLFRQTQYGEWGDVVERVRAALERVKGIEPSS